MLAEVRRRFISAVVVVAIVMVVVSSIGHIKASTRTVPVSLTDPNSDAADSDIGTFRNDNCCRQRSKNRQMPASSEAEQEKAQTQQSS
jgi:hypothetical protein